MAGDRVDAPLYRLAESPDAAELHPEAYHGAQDIQEPAALDRLRQVVERLQRLVRHVLEGLGNAHRRFLRPAGELVHRIPQRGQSRIKIG